MKGVSLVVRSKGKKIWELRAEKVTLSKDEQILKVEGLKKAVLYRKGKPALTATADRAVANNRTKNVTLEGNVRLVTSEGLLIKTDRVEWRARERKLLCPGPIIASTKDFTLSTYHVALYADKKLLVCPSPVKAWTPDGGRLKARRLKAELDKGIITLEGEVVVVLPWKGELLWGKGS